MTPKHAAPWTREQHADLVAELLRILAEMFDLETAIAGTTLHSAMERRLLALADRESPCWGTTGDIAEIATDASEALEFFYRPHLFPGMDDRLRLAHQLQFDLLPRSSPERSPLHLSAVLESYCHLSGDLLGWHRDGDDLVLWIADISGHGVRAGLAAAVFYLLVADLAPGLDPGTAATTLSGRFLAARSARDERPLYATAVWARLNPDGRGSYTSAGHPAMLLRRADGRVEELPSTGMPLGLFPDTIYHHRSLELARDDLLLLFTDGLVEATNDQGEEVGSRWLEGVLRATEGHLPETTRAIYRRFSQLTDRDATEDDLTYLLASRRP